MSVRRLIDPTTEEVEQGVNALHESFKDHALFPSNAEWNPEIMRLIMKSRFEVGCKDHSTYVYQREGKAIEGVAYCNPPGVAFGEAINTPGGPLKYHERMSPDHVKWIKETVGPWFKDSFAKAYPGTQNKDSLYINLLGVSPSAQGTGAGGALLDYLCAMGDDDGVEMTLCTQVEKSALWYSRWGFQTVHQSDLEAKGVIVPSWFMLRPAKKTQ